MKKLLIVDDNPLNIFTLKSHLAHSGLVMDAAASAAEACALHQNNRYDIILLDYYLPDATGLEIAKNIREYDREQQHRKTILISISADSNPALRDILLASGFDQVLHKPLTKARLLEALQGYLPAINLAESASPAATAEVQEIPGIHLRELKKWLPSNEREAWQLMGEFISTTQEGIDAMRQALAHHDLAKIILEAHRLKTPPKAFGMYELAAGLEALQQAAQSQQSQPDLEMLIDSLQVSLQRIERQLGQLLIKR